MERCAYSAAAVVLSTLIASGLDAQIAERGSDDVLAVQIDGKRYRLKLELDNGLRPSNVFYVTGWNKKKSHLGDVYPPLDEDHPAYREPCFLCEQPLGNGHLVQAVVWGPTTRADRIAHWEGEDYGALATLVHAICAQGEPRRHKHRMPAT